MKFLRCKIIILSLITLITLPGSSLGQRLPMPEGEENTPICYIDDTLHDVKDVQMKLDAEKEGSVETHTQMGTKTAKFRTIVANPETAPPVEMEPRIRWLSGPGVNPVGLPPQPAGVNDPAYIRTTLQTKVLIDPGESKGIDVSIIVASRARTGTYTFSIDWYDADGNYLTDTDPTLILYRTYSSGLNILYLTIISIFLVIVGGYLIQARMRKATDKVRTE